MPGIILFATPFGLHASSPSSIGGGRCGDCVIVFSFRWFAARTASRIKENMLRIRIRVYRRVEIAGDTTVSVGVGVGVKTETPHCKIYEVPLTNSRQQSQVYNGRWSLRLNCAY
jgi:hypothetical protein